MPQATFNPLDISSVVGTRRADGTVAIEFESDGDSPSLVLIGPRTALQAMAEDVLSALLGLELELLRGHALAAEC